MCYYLTQRSTDGELIRFLGKEKPLDGFPSLDQPVMVGFEYPSLFTLIAEEERPGWTIREMEWGFIPSYWETRQEAQRYRQGFKEEKSGRWVQYLTLNARSETLLDPTKMFRAAALSRRCLIPARGFFEWRQVIGYNKRTGAPLKTPKKFPYYIHLSEAREEPKAANFLFIAGVYQPWTDKETGETVDTLSLVTTEANGLMKKIHNSRFRMPTILPEAKAWDWLNPQSTEEVVDRLARTQVSDLFLKAHPIEKDFLQQSDPSRPADYADLPPL